MQTTLGEELFFFGNKKTGAENCSCFSNLTKSILYEKTLLRFISITKLRTKTVN
jgi:hypothetical protein